jgi:hypothetical protein
MDDTALHGIGHTLGLPHEHQNPNAGIVWDEKTVYTSLGGPPNSWPRRRPSGTSCARSSRTPCRAPTGTPTGPGPALFQPGLG